MMAETGEGLGGSWEYCTDLFEPSTAARMARHFVSLLASLVESPERPVETAELLDAEERARVLGSWSEGPRVDVAEGNLAGLLRERARLSPGQEALVCGAERLDYRELEARARRLGHRLRREGVGPEVRVGVLLERGVDVGMAFWGVQLAGGVYVPLDAMQPRERLEWMVEDSRPLVVVTRAGLGERCRVPSSVRVLRLDEPGDDAAGPLESAAGFDHAAYVIYTSGSTGRPKGVELTHRGALHRPHPVARLRARRGRPRAPVRAARLRCVHLRVPHDGGRGRGADLPPAGELLVGEGLKRTLVEGRVDTATLPPSVLALLPPEGLETLRTVVSAGEACPPELVARWAPGRRFLNAYGPTEVTVCASWAECRADEARPPPIGGPLGNTQVYVLDAALRPVPPGVAGELYVGGPGVARGYLGRPELTAERFVPHPFAREPGARLYRTGDVVRWRVDGALEYLGRADAQVKLRGMRVEPGEIETALLEVLGVRRALVRPWKGPDGETRLVAYLVPGASPLPEGREVRERLRSRLPEHMLPSAFVPLEALPLTPHGKVDARALPPPQPPGRSASFVAPRTPLEVSIARAWGGRSAMTAWACTSTSSMTSGAARSPWCAPAPCCATS
ncbi:non-ribosomal peptide synthetase [Cystobacter fuscus]